MAPIATIPMTKLSFVVPLMLSLVQDKPPTNETVTMTTPHVHKKHHWTYHGVQGPETWATEFPLCGGTRQSPINIDLRTCQHDPALEDFRLHNFHLLSTAAAVGEGNVLCNFTNNGHSASVRVTGEMTVEGGGLPGQFRTAGFHFHWGSRSDLGSEHGINSVKFPLEMHVVNYASKYGSLKNAVDKPDGLAVLGVMFEISDHDNPDFEPLASLIQHIHKAGEFRLVDGLRLRSLLPADTSKYYRYAGSLTTPGCYESVTWTVFAEPMKISERQLAGLRDLEHEEGHFSPEHEAGHNMPNRLVDNWRPLQPLHDRTVRRSFPGPTPSSSVTSSNVSHSVEDNESPHSNGNATASYSVTLETTSLELVVPLTTSPPAPPTTTAPPPPPPTTTTETRYTDTATTQKASPSRDQGVSANDVIKSLQPTPFPTTPALPNMVPDTVNNVAPTSFVDSSLHTYQVMSGANDVHSNDVIVSLASRIPGSQHLMQDRNQVVNEPASARSDPATEIPGATPAAAVPYQTGFSGMSDSAGLKVVVDAGAGASGAAAGSYWPALVDSNTLETATLAPSAVRGITSPSASASLPSPPPPPPATTAVTPPKPTPPKPQPAVASATSTTSPRRHSEESSVSSKPEPIVSGLPNATARTESREALSPSTVTPAPCAPAATVAPTTPKATTTPSTRDQLLNLLYQLLELLKAKGGVVSQLMSPPAQPATATVTDQQRLGQLQQDLQQTIGGVLATVGTVPAKEAPPLTGDVFNDNTMAEPLTEACSATCPAAKRPRVDPGNVTDKVPASAPAATAAAGGILSDVKNQSQSQHKQPLSTPSPSSFQAAVKSFEATVHLQNKQRHEQHQRVEGFITSGAAPVPSAGGEGLPAGDAQSLASEEPSTNRAWGILLNRNPSPSNVGQVAAANNSSLAGKTPNSAVNNTRPAAGPGTWSGHGFPISGGGRLGVGVTPYGDRLMNKTPGQRPPTRGLSAWPSQPSLQGAQPRQQLSNNGLGPAGGLQRTSPLQPQQLWQHRLQQQQQQQQQQQPQQRGSPTANRRFQMIPGVGANRISPYVFLYRNPDPSRLYKVFYNRVYPTQQTVTTNVGK